MITALKYLRNPYVLLGIVVIVLALVWKFQGSLFNINVPQDLPDEPNLTDSERQAVRELSMRLHADMKGINVFSSARDREAWAQLMSMSDRLFVAVSNDYNRLYYRESQGTLRQWVSDEAWWVDVAGIAGKNQVLERMAGLNIQ